MLQRSHIELEHIARVKRNDALIKRLGLSCRKNSLQTYSITITQGDFQLFHEWTTHSGNDTKIELHKNLEAFLLRYYNHIHGFPYAKERELRMSVIH